jgi:acyl-coenzyme A thioesterase PaaI-like protein
MRSDILASEDVGRSGGPLESPAGAGFGRLVQSLRDLQAVLAAAAPPDHVAEAAAAQLSAVEAALRPHVVPEVQRYAGRCPDLPGRGHPLLLPLVVDEETSTRVTGRVTFSQFHLGGNGAAHGGTLPLLFDEVVGRLASHVVGDRRARTAYLHVNYRAITPLDRELRVEGTVDSIEGRKRFASGRLYDGDRLLADAEGLFVELLPGQP